MARVYLETSFFSECVTIRTGTIDLGRRATSLHWWRSQASAFDLCISPEVVRELSSSAFPTEVREPALSMLEGLEVLESTSDVLGVAELLVQERVMPSPSVEGDALHVAFSIVHQVEFLLTWNQKHLANPRKRTHLMVICARLNLPTPQIVTPDLLIVEDTNG
ncbi:MAG TPA: hypothetical protein VN541_01230 [Tepidisphaeraceae bacterium]|nr:hypothetical protein [Tepidisphaeraceae bacterium]